MNFGEKIFKLRKKSKIRFIECKFQLKYISLWLFVIFYAYYTIVKGLSHQLFGTTAPFFTHKHLVYDRLTKPV